MLTVHKLYIWKINFQTIPNRKLIENIRMT